MLTGSRYQAQALNFRCECLKRFARTVGACAGGAGQGLYVDVAEISKRIAFIGKLRRKVVKATASTQPRLLSFLVNFTNTSKVIEFDDGCLARN